MVGELVLNQVEGKEFFTIKMVYSALIPIFQHPSVPSFHGSGINQELLKNP
ncbi:MAG: hypothetical protein PVH36_14000 [Desulfobacterales bacterium]|jgi:hypothetical protein